MLDADELGAAERTPKIVIPLFKQRAAALIGPCINLRVTWKACSRHLPEVKARQVDATAEATAMRLGACK
jgi:hypothetical protein